MKFKVCGMRDAENIKALAALNPDFMGFIFYDKSPRFVGDMLSIELLQQLPKSIKKVGVFVNATESFIMQSVRKYGLDYVQLHGKEMPDFCKNLRLKGINIIKAFSVDENFMFSMLNNYKPHVDFFLFDTKTKTGEEGGTGIKFDWNILKKYDNEKPFLLAGGIDLDNINDLEQLSGMNIYAIDVNSKFELAPAMKDINKIRQLATIIKPKK